MEITRTRMYRDDQSLYIDRHITLNDGQKMLIKIRRNAYDFQSYGRVSLWTSEAGRKVLFTEPIENLMVSEFSYVSRDEAAWKSAIEMDAIELADQAFDVLGIGVKNSQKLVDNLRRSCFNDYHKEQHDKGASK